MQKRYLVATLVAGFLFAGLLGSAHLLRQSCLAEFRQSLREARDKGDLPEELKDIDVETATFEGFDTEMSESAILMYDLAEMIGRFWFVWLMLLLLVCWGVASLLPSVSE